MLHLVLTVRCNSFYLSTCHEVLKFTCPMWARGNLPLSLHFPTFYFILQYLLLFPFSLLTLFTYFLAFPSFSILPE